MRYDIEAQRDLGLVAADLGGWQGLLDPGETKFERCHDSRAEHYALFQSDTGLPGTSVHVDDFPTREAAQHHIDTILIV